MTNTVDVHTLAECLATSERTIQRLAKDGVVHRLNDGEYLLVESVSGYVEHLQRNSADSAERRALLQARRKAVDLQNDLQAEQLARTRGEVYDRATIDRDFTVYAAEVVKLHKSFVPYLKKRHPKVPERVWQAIDERLEGIRQAAKRIRVSEDAVASK